MADYRFIPPARALLALLATLPVLAVACETGCQASAAATVGQLGAPAGMGQLEGARGGAAAASTSASATLSGNVGGNSASNVTTGANAIGGGAFAGASGIPVVIQNSGANVLIQNATVINLQFTQ